MRTSLITALLSVLLISGMSASSLTLTEKDADKEVTMNRGDLLTVSLPANPTTGYSWGVLMTPEGLLSEKESRYQSSDQMGNLMGSGGVTIWRFRAVKSGSTQLSFSYVRPWEKGIAPARVLKWSVLVN